MTYGGKLFSSASRLRSARKRSNSESSMVDARAPSLGRRASFTDQPLMKESARQVAPFVDRPMFADPVYTQGIVTGREHAFGPGAAKNIDDIGRAEALMALSQSCNA